MEETLHRNRSVQLCSLRCRIKMAILALSQKGDISEMFLGKVANVESNPPSGPIRHVFPSGSCDAWFPCARPGPIISYSVTFLGTSLRSPPWPYLFALATLGSVMRAFIADD